MNGVREMTWGLFTTELQDDSEWLLKPQSSHQLQNGTIAAAASEEEQINAFFRQYDSGAGRSLIIGAANRCWGTTSTCLQGLQNLLQRHTHTGMVEVTSLPVKLEAG